MATHRMHVGDDGTLDTVIVCQCGAEFRYNADELDATPYDEFLEWALEDAATQHDADLDANDN
jgi:hypothetical protein